MKRPESSGVKMDTLQVSFVKSGLTTHADVDESCVCTTREQNVTINTVNNVNILTLENPRVNQLIETEDKKRPEIKNDGKCSFTVRTWERKS